MNAKRFRAPVTVFSGNPSRFRIVSNAIEAADFLYRNRPGHDSECWNSALTQCKAAVEGYLTAEEARAAFITAASEAGVQFNADVSLG